VPISPFVDAPQMKKLPASSQKSREGSGVRRGCAVCPQAEVGRTVAQKECDDRHDREGRDPNRYRGAAPAAVLRQPAEEGQKDELAGRARRREGAEHEPATLDEPPVGDRRGQHRCHTAGAEPDHHAP
jgi:hypothetical protein